MILTLATNNKYLWNMLTGHKYDRKIKCRNGGEAVMLGLRRECMWWAVNYVAIRGTMCSHQGQHLATSSIHLTSRPLSCTPIPFSLYSSTKFQASCHMRFPLTLSLAIAEPSSTSWLSILLFDHQFLPFQLVYVGSAPTPSPQTDFPHLIKTSTDPNTILLFISSLLTQPR